MRAGLNSASGQIRTPFACFKCEVWRNVLTLLACQLLYEVVPGKNNTSGAGAEDVTE